MRNRRKLHLLPNLLATMGLSLKWELSGEVAAARRESLFADSSMLCSRPSPIVKRFG
jgi:hypothetical protein